jgi:hypothetical protein
MSILDMGRRFALRAFCCYAALYVIYVGQPMLFAVLGLHQASAASSLLAPIFHVVVPWIAVHIIHLSTPITVFTNGSGDTRYDWILMAVHITIAATAAVVWMLLDRRSERDAMLEVWLRFGLRTFLAFELLWYGCDKLVPVQFGALTDATLEMPVRSFAPMGILWTSMAASPGYTMFAGAVESAAGLALLVPQLSKVGALIAVVAMANVFALNVFYDVPVKLVSLHLLAFAIFLALPEIVRLRDALVTNRAVLPASGQSFIDRSSVGPIIYATWILAIFFVGVSISRNLASRASMVETYRVDSQRDQIHLVSEYPRFFVASGRSSGGSSTASLRSTSSRPH